MSTKICTFPTGIRVALTRGMMRGVITEVDFEECECAFPGIVRYYRELKEKPATFLELLWGFMHEGATCPDRVPVAPRPAIRAMIR